MRVSFDYLVNALRLLDDKDYRYKEDLPQAKLALGEKEALLQSGLVEHYQKRVQHDRGLGRFRKGYRRTKPYAKIKVRHLITSTFPHAKFERHLFRCLGNIRLAQLDDVSLPYPYPNVSSYSAERLIRCLVCLDTDRFIPLHPKLYRVTSVARLIMRDMANIGVVTVRHTGNTCEYKLSVPLTELPIEVLLPYLCTAATNRQYYNRLFHVAKDKPISLLSMK